MAVPFGRLRLDVGRLIMVPAFAVILVADVFSLDHGAHSGAAGVLRSVGTVLALAFYALAIWCYLRRGPAVATSDSVTAHAAAIAATWLPFALPLLPGAPPGQGRQALSDVLLVCGMAWAVWSLRFLDRNVSVLAQARDVVDRGPYRWVRHPALRRRDRVVARSRHRREQLRGTRALAGAVRSAGLPGGAGGAGAAAGVAGLPQLPKPDRRPATWRLLKRAPNVAYRHNSARVPAVAAECATSFALCER